MMEDYSQKTDLELVKLALEDSDDFYYLAHRYESKLFRYICRLLSCNEATCEDVLQEVLIKIYLNLNEFDKKLKFSSWAYRITHNEAISYYRKHKNLSKNIDIDDDKYKNLVKETFDIKENLIKDEEKRKVHEIIDSMSQNYKDILILRFLEEKDYKEISDILMKPIGTISAMINRAKKIFKNRAEKLDLT